MVLLAISSGIVQGLSIDINLKHTQHIDKLSVTTLTHVVGGTGDDVEEPGSSKYYIFSYTLCSQHKV